MYSLEHAENVPLAKPSAFLGTFIPLSGREQIAGIVAASAGFVFVLLHAEVMTGSD